MTDVFDLAVRSRIVSSIRGKGTRPHTMARRGLQARGFRYRLHDREFPSRSNLVFPYRSAMIQARGCFWHGHGSQLFKWPRFQADFWRWLITGKRGRDAGNLVWLQSGDRKLTGETAGAA